MEKDFNLFFHSRSKELIDLISFCFATLLFKYAFLLDRRTNYKTSKRSFKLGVRFFLEYWVAFNIKTHFLSNKRYGEKELTTNPLKSDIVFTLHRQ